MRRKELQRKMQAVAMAAVVTLTTVGAPVTAFAEEFPAETTAEDFSDDGEGNDFSDGADITTQSSDGEAGAVEEVPEVQADENGAGAIADGDADGATDAEKTAAQEYLKANFIDGSNKAISNGGAGVVKSEDGLTYNVGLTTTPNGTSKISSLRFKYLNSDYKTGWYIAKDNPYVGYKEPTVTSSRGISGRPTAEEGPYSFKATLKLFAKDTEDSAINDGTATPLATQDFTIILAADKKKYTVNVKPVDAKTGAAIENATVGIEKDWNSLKPESDGSYTLEEDQEYTLIVTADGYDKYTQTFKPSVSGDMEVKLSPIIYRNTTFAVTGSDGATITDADITVKEGWYTTLSPQEDGSYKLQAGKEYKYTITKDGYKDASGSFTVPDETGDYTYPVTLQSNIDPADQAAVDAVKAEFDKEKQTLRPVYGTDTNITDMVLAKIQKYNLDVDISNVKVSLETSGDTDYIGKDGTIHYAKDELNIIGVYSQNLNCTFKFTCNNASAVSDDCRVTVGWDQEYFKSKMQTEADKLTWDSIKGNNVSQEEVTSDLTLPGCMGSSMKNVWSTVTWESSDPDVISLQRPAIDSPIYPGTGKVTPKTEDTVVTLTATFNANDTLLNSYVGENAEKFGTITKTFKVTVKGTGVQAPTEEELKAILDKYYTADQLQDFTTNDQLDTSNCTGDIQLPRYTRIEDENGNRVFNNKEITVTSSDPKLLAVNGYRVAVDLFQYDKDTTANLIVTFTRDGVTAVKEIPITVSVKDINEKLDKELAMMDYAKEHYFDGIKGENTDAGNITANMQAFQEMYFDSEGKAVWVHNANDKTNAGIAPDNYFEDSWEMEGAGYNHFKSSNNAIIQHENLVVIRPESNTEIEISSLLSSEKYGQFAKEHPNNEKLQKLYKQEASVKVTVKGTKTESEALKAKLQDANTLLGTITEGTEGGQYPEGTKKTLEDAIAAAQAVSDNAEATEAQQTEAIAALAKAMKECQESRNPQNAEVTVIANIKGNTAGETHKITVKATDAAAYGYTKPESTEAEVTVLDALADLHAAMYGDAFKKAPQDYLVVPENGWVSKAFGIEGGSIGFLVNNKMPGDAMSNTAVLNSGDILNVYLYNDTTGWSDAYLYFTAVDSDIMANRSFTLNVKGYGKVAWGGNAEAQKDITVELRDSEGKTAATGVTDENGNVTLKVTAAGTYEAVITKTPYEYYIPVSTQITAKPHEHTFTKWTKVSDATVFAPEKQESTCDLCGEKTTKDVGEKLAPTVKLGKTELALTLKQSETVEVSGLANGDSVDSWTSSATDIVTVDKNGKITAGTKEGKAVVTVTLASGKKAEIAVTVKEKEHVYTKWTKVSDATVFAPEKQESICDLCGQKTTKEVGSKLTPTVKLGKTELALTLKQSETVEVSGLAKGDSVTGWASSDTGIVTVDKNGKITAGTKEGKAVVTVTLASGKKAEIAVTVKEKEHVYTKWTKVSDATVFAPEKQESTCDLCGQKTTKEVGSKLAPTVTLSNTELALNLKQSEIVEVSGLAKGDSVKSWTSSATDIVTVDKNGKIAAGTKEGKAVVTVTLVSGKKAEIAVTVKEKEHVYTKWIKVSDATVFAPEKQESTCDLCGQKTTREVGEKLAPTVDLSKTELTLALNLKQSETVEVSGLAKGDSVKSWTSSDTAVVTVDKNGKITAGTKEGKAVVTVALASGKKVAITVTVKEKEHVYTKWTKVSDATALAPEKQESICDLCGQKTTKEVGQKLPATVKLSRTTLALKVKQSAAVKASGLAKGDSIKSWTSSDSRIAKVDKNGKITAGTREGKAVITVTLASGKTAKVTVTVKLIRTTKLSNISRKLTLTVGKKYALKPVVTPSNSQQKVVYRTSNASVAAVGKTGIITAKKAGMATVAVQSGSKIVYIRITVKARPALKAIKNVPTKKTIVKGKTYTLKPKLYPTGAAGKVTYTSSKKNIATVDAKGKITAKKKGTTVITVKAGKFTAKCKITVK